MGSDAAQTQQFYRDLFDWEIDSNNPMNYGIVLPGQRGIGGGVGAEPGGQARASVYAEVPDPQAALDRAVALGGEVVMPVTEIPEMVTFALFRDPSGNITGIVKG